MDSLIFRKRHEDEYSGKAIEKWIDARDGFVLINSLSLQDNRINAHDHTSLLVSEFDEIVVKYLEYRIKSEQPIEELYKAVLKPIHAMLDRINGFSDPAEQSGEV